MVNVLVLCTGNSCRSQMAEGYLRRLGNGQLQVWSAGVETHGVNPKAIEIMAQDGIDIAHHTSNHLDEYSQQPFDFVITVCDHAQEQCPIFPGKAVKLHQNFPDPAKATGNEEEIMESFAHTRDLIKAYSKEFVNKYI